MSLKQWWTLDEASEKQSVDNPFGPVGPEQRQASFPMLVMAFGWGFLITGLLTGGALGAGVPFYPDFIIATSLGNLVNFIIGALVGYMGYRTGCNSGLLYRFVYGRIGAMFPVLFLAMLTIGWQAIIVGAFGFAWTQSFDSPAFYAVAIFGGLLFTGTTYFGIKGLERVALPAVAVLVAVGLFAGYLSISAAGGWPAFLQMSATTAAASPISMISAINLVIGSWIVGAVVMAEYTRFARHAWVAVAIPFIVLMVSQWFLQIVGAMGGIVSGSADFTTYMLQQGMVIGGIGLIGMSVALWTTGDTNLYLPVIQTASVFRRPKRVMVVICGLLGTVLGLGIYQYFLSWIDLLAALCPPLIGPVLVDYYLVHRRRYAPEDLERLHTANGLAFIAYAAGAVAALLAPAGVVPSLFGLLVSMLVYGLACALAAALRMKVGYAAVVTPD